MKRLYMWMALLTCFLQVAAQHIIMSEIPTRNQFPAGDILCSYQDSEGYIWYATTRGGLYRDDGYTVKAFRSDQDTPKLLESNSITGITGDKEHNIWFGTKRGVYILDKTNYSIKPLPDEKIKGWVIHTVLATSDGSVWVSTERAIYRYNLQGERLGTYPVQWQGKIRYVYKFYEDSNNNLWIVQWKGGLLRYDAKQDKFIPYPWPFSEHPTGILKDATSPYYWIGTWGKGIVRFDPNEADPAKMFVQQPASTGADMLKGQINSIAQDSVLHYIWTTTMTDLYVYSGSNQGTLQTVPTDNFLSPEKKIVHHIQCDRSGNLWVSAYYPHSFVISFRADEFSQYTLPRVKKEFGFPVTPVKLVYENGNYWFWQMRQNLCYYQTADDRLSVYQDQGLLVSCDKSDHRKGFLAIKNYSMIVWIREEDNQIKESNICTLSLKPNERIRTLHEDASGHIWIGTTFDLIRYDQHDGKFHRVWENTGIINQIVTTPDGNVFAATESNGLLKLTPNGKKEQYTPVEDNYTGLNTTPDQHIWIRTQQSRLYFYNATLDTIIPKKFEYDLSNDVICDTQCDDQGNLWILYDQKVVIYNPAQESFHLIRCSDPSLSLNNFLTLYKDGKGNMHIGGTGGILVFPPYSEVDKVINTPINLTHIRVNGVDRYADSPQKKIILQPNEQNLELFFSTFDPVNRNKIRFAFRYKGQKSYWNYLPEGQNNIYLTELSKGDYELEIRATKSNGSWSENTLTVFICRLPAWYETGWAYVLYGFLFLTIVGVVVRKYLKYQKSKEQIRMEEQIAQMKYRFFTNVSHELRTPLTLIITPLETIVRKVSDTDIKRQLESVGRNARDLLELVNQLLDFRKVEMGGETLSLTKGDINCFLTSIYENFRLMAEEKNLQFSYKSTLSSFYLFFDHDKLRKMVNNLLSNAFKFTQANGRIILSLQEERKEDRNGIVIRVEDTGIGIPADELDSIFERFHQADSQERSAGSGIGLHLVKEYATMHQGEITVQSQPGKGSIFSLNIPADLMADEKNTVSTSFPNEEKKTVLIVEDNTEFRTYMKNELSHYYTVYESANGVEGETKALEIEPDIIITDLMMPEMDGIELCRRIKNNINISHIPVILLTANDTLENEQRGYKEGADAYLGKPFHWDILLLRIQNLLEQKHQRQLAFEKEIEVKPDNLTISAADEQFLARVLKIIEKNISDSEYSIENLSRDMAMSRVSLYRKINSITSNTPTEFVKNIRLKKAAEFLKQGQLTIAEVAYEVGFNSPGYFTQAFKKAFGMLPTQYK